MKAKKKTVRDEILQEIVRRIVAAVKPEKIILFGSAAREEMGPDSDVDLLVIKPCGQAKDGSENRAELSWNRHPYRHYRG